MSAATEQQNNGDVVVEKIAADAVKDDLKSQKAAVEVKKPAATDNGTASKDEANEEDSIDAAPPKVKGTKRPSDAKNSESKKAKKEKAPDADSDDDDVIDDEGGEGDSDIESDEYDIPYDGEEDDIECEDDEDDNDDGSGSDDQA